MLKTMIHLYILAITWIRYPVYIMQPECISCPWRSLPLVEMTSIFTNVIPVSLRHSSSYATIEPSLHAPV